MKIRTFSDNDENNIRTLFLQCFGKELSHEVWSWKYKCSPWGSTAAVATYDDTIIAHYGGLKVKFWHRGKSFDVYQPCDVMTHPKYRARIFSRRGAMVRAGEYFYSVNPMDFAFGFPSERHAILGTKQLGYTEHRYVTLLHKRVSRVRHIGNFLLRTEKGWNCVNEAEIDALWGATIADYGLSVEKSSRYFFWRFRDNPARRYEPLIVRNRLGKALKAFAVFSRKENELLVLDFLCAKDLNIRALFRIFENMAILHGLKGIKLWMNPNEDFFRILIDCGYKAEKGIPHIFKILNEEITPSFLFDRYCYRMGDYDDA
jgi:hypothetical protein